MVVSKGRCGFCGSWRKVWWKPPPLPLSPQEASLANVRLLIASKVKTHVRWLIALKINTSKNFCFVICACVGFGWLSYDTQKTTKEQKQRPNWHFQEILGSSDENRWMEKEISPLSWPMNAWDSNNSRTGYHPTIQSKLAPAPWNNSVMCVDEGFTHVWNHILLFLKSTLPT